MGYEDLLNISNNIWQIIEEKNCIAWVGAGLSLTLDYPTWQETITQLCDKCEIDFLSTQELNSPDKLIDKTEECKIKNNEVYKNTLGTLFGEIIVEIRQAYQLLLKLPFKGYVTTNFDPLLSNAGIIQEQSNIYSYPSLPIIKLGEDFKPIFYLHGIARKNNEPDGSKLILARSDFEYAYNHSLLPSFLEQLLTYHDIFFIGCSLSEPILFKVFEKVKKIHDQIKSERRILKFPARKILLPIQKVYEKKDLGQVNSRNVSIELEENTRFKAMGVDVLTYENTRFINPGLLNY